MELEAQEEQEEPAVKEDFSLTRRGSRFRNVAVWSITINSKEHF